MAPETKNPIKEWKKKEKAQIEKQKTQVLGYLDAHVEARVAAPQGSDASGARAGRPGNTISVLTFS